MQKLLVPPLGYSCAEEQLHRCHAPLSGKHAPFVEALCITAIVNFSNVPIHTQFSEAVTVHSIPVSTGRTLHMQAVLDYLEVVFSLSNFQVLLVGSTKNNFDSIVIACLRRLQKWSMISILSELRATVTQRSVDVEQFIESFDADLSSLISPSGAPKYLQIYIDAAVRVCVELGDVLPCWFNTRYCRMRSQNRLHS